jgi:cyclohexadieny/prephenate dehydrogenase
MATRKKSPLFNTISIIGLGLIGSSIARAARKNKLCNNIVAYNKNGEVSKKAIKLEIIDTVALSPEDAARGADLVILCTPISTYGDIIKKIAPHLGEHAIITDVGSVKYNVISDIGKELNTVNLPNFVAGHPIAGSEKSGLDAGSADLFKNRQTILTPSEITSSNAIEKIKKMWKAFGSNVEIMDAGEHDKIYATASHLPHLISFCFMNALGKLEKHEVAEIHNFADDAFRGFVRLAASSPAMWSDIFVANKEAILPNMKKFYAPPSLALIKSEADSERLFERLLEAKSKRKLLPVSNKETSAHPTGRAYIFMNILPKIIAGITIESVENTEHVGGGFLGLTENILNLSDRFAEYTLDRKELANEGIEALLNEVTILRKIIEASSREMAGEYIENAGRIYKRL